MSYKDPIQRRDALRRWRAANPEKARAIWKRQTKNPLYKEQQKKRSHDWHIANRAHHKALMRINHYKRVHGVTPEQVTELLAAQGGKCGICGSADPRSQMHGWQLDHNHQYKPGDPKYIRGILCANCNRGGGQFNDDPILLRKAADWFSNP